ncbi:hypothetical protein JOF53_000259 [Crossiella equi]|uniref:ABC-2 family transporter protein n=1 Tax=Crossiella equi TaxID=130796 RepID=A0ABS5A525_9PSEU|nr:hypothetical protein [Crossiella equi]MBP2471387.1 hypothetical protein [Crossiella equi]
MTTMTAPTATAAPIGLGALLRAHFAAFRAHRAGQLAFLLPAVLGTALLTVVLANVSVVDGDVQSAGVGMYLSGLSLFAGIAGAVLAVDPWARRGVTVVLGVSSDRARWFGAHLLASLVNAVLALALAAGLGLAATWAVAAVGGQDLASVTTVLLAGYGATLLNFVFGFALGAATRSVLFALLLVLALPLGISAAAAFTTGSQLAQDVLSWLNVDAAFTRLFEAGPLPLWQAIVITVVVTAGPLALALARNARSDLR